MNEQDRQDRSEAFSKGLSIGSKVENRVAVGSLVTALLNVLGKDAADGIIDLGVAGTWVAGDPDSFAVRKDVQ